MSDIFIAYEGGMYRCYTTTNGIVRRYVGCGHEKPRQAHAHTSGTYVPASRSAVRTVQDSGTRTADRGAERLTAPLPTPPLRQRGHHMPSRDRDPEPERDAHGSGFGF